MKLFLLIFYLFFTSFGLYGFISKKTPLRVILIFTGFSFLFFPDLLRDFGIEFGDSSFYKYLDSIGMMLMFLGIVSLVPLALKKSLEQ